MPTAFDDLLVDEPVANANAFDDLLMDEPPKEKSFFGLGDTASALAEIPSELYQGIPIAFRRMRLGLQDPSSYSPEDAAAFEAESQRQAVLQQEQEAREARGENTSVGDAFRGAVRSLPFSVSTMVPSIAAGAGTGAAVGAVFPPSELVTVPVGAIAGTIGGMAAGGTAAYRMAGQQFLDDSIRGLQDKAKSEGKTLSKEELDNAYEVLLPIAENTGLWEAGPEAVGNAVTAGAGKFIFGFGKDLAADVVKRTLGKKIAAAVGATGVEVGGETITAMNQGPDQAKAQQFIETGSTEGAVDEYQGIEGFGKALAEVGPTTLATQALMGGLGGGVKLGEMGLKKLIGKQNTQDPFNPEAPITEDDTSAEDLTLDEATALEPPAPVIPAPEEIEKRQEQEIKEAANLKIDAAAPVITQDLVANESPLTAVAMNQALNASNDEADAQKIREAEIEAATAIQAAQKQAAGIKPTDDPSEILRSRNKDADAAIVRDEDGFVDRNATKLLRNRLAQEAGMTRDAWEDEQAAKNVQAKEDFFFGLDKGDILTWTDGNGNQMSGIVEINLSGKPEVRDTTEGGASQDFLYSSKSGEFMQNADSLKVTKPQTQPQTQETKTNEESILLQQASNETQANVREAPDGQGQEEVSQKPISEQPSKTVQPRSTQSVAPKPQRVGRDTTDRDAWDEAYGDMRKGGRSHNDDGSPYQPTVFDETMPLILSSLAKNGDSPEQRLDAVGDQTETTIASSVKRLLNGGWVWDSNSGKMVNPNNPSENPAVWLANPANRKQTTTKTQAAEIPDPFESPLPETITANVPTATSPTDSPRTQDPFEDAPTQGEEVSTQREAVVPASGGTVAPAPQQEVTSKTSLTESQDGDTGVGMDDKRIKRLDEDLQMSGVAYDGAIRYAIKQASDETYYVEKTQDGQRESISTGHSDIDTARNAAISGIRNQGLESQAGVESNQPDAGVGAQRGAGDKATSKSDGSNVQESNAPNKPVIRRTGAKVAGASVSGQQSAAMNASRIATLRLLNQATNAYPNEDFNGIDPSQIDEVRDYMITIQRNQPPTQETQKRGAGTKKDKPKTIEEADARIASQQMASGFLSEMRAEAELEQQRKKRTDFIQASAQSNQERAFLNDLTSGGWDKAMDDVAGNRVSPVRASELALMARDNGLIDDFTAARFTPTPETKQPPPTIPAKEQVDEGRGTISPKSSPKTPKQGRPTVAKVDVAESPKTDTKSTEQKNQASDPIGYGESLIDLFPSIRNQGVTVISMEEAMVRLDAEWDRKVKSGKATKIDQLVYMANKKSTQAAIDGSRAGGSNIGGRWSRTDKTIAVATNATPSAMAHELGHAIMELEYANASQETKNAITEEYNQWFAAKYGKGGVPSVADQRRIWEWMKESDWLDPSAPFPQDQRVASWENYRSSFDEWFADEVAKWATVRTEPRSLIGKFFSELSAKLEKLWNKVSVHFSPSTTLASWLDSISKPSPSKQDSKSTEQKRLEAQLEKVEADILDAEADGDERGADGLRAAKLKIERQLEDIAQSIPASTIKQGDTIRFKQEGQTLSGTYVGPVNQSGKQVYEVQVAGEPRSRRVTAQSINGSNDAQLEGTKFSRINNEQGTRLNGPEANIGNNKRGENETNGASVRGNISPQEGGEDSLGLSPGDNSERANAIRNAVSGIDWKNATAAERIKALADFSSRVASGFVQLPASSNVSVTITRKEGERIGAGVVGTPNGKLLVEINTGPDTKNSNTHEWDNPEAAFAYAYDVMQEESIHALQHAIAFRRWKAVGSPGKFEKFSNQKQVDSLLEVLRQYSSFVKSGDVAAAQKIQRALLDSWNLYRDLNNPVNSINELVDLFMKDERVAVELMPELTRQLVQLTREDFTTETGWRKFFNQVKGWIQDAINSLKAVLPLARNGDLGPIIQQDIKELESMMRDYRDGKPMGKYSRQRTTRPKTQGLERKVAEKHLKKLGVPSSKVYIIDEPSIQIKGRYDPDGGIALNIAYLDSVEEINDTLMNHEAIHDAVETDKKVKQRAIELLDALTDDEMSIINEQIRGYSENEKQDERIVEAVRLMTSRRPDLRTKWARFVEAVSLAIKKFLGIKNLDRQVAELTAARILARGRDRVMRGKMGGRDKFSGNMYSYAGERAETPQFMRDSLDAAKAMAAAGKSSEEIRAATGWFPGKYDGKMRWEIPDDEATPKGVTQSRVSPPSIVRGTVSGGRFTESKNGDLYAPIIDGSPSVMDATGSPDEAISRWYKWFYPDKTKTTGWKKDGKLADVLSHPALFESYPELRDVDVVFRSLDGIGGDWNRGANLIRIKEGMTDNQTMSILLHEIQHAIQSIEGFARGSNRSEFSDYTQSAKSRIEYYRVELDALADAFILNGYMDKGADLGEAKSLFRTEFNRDPNEQSGQHAKFMTRQELLDETDRMSERLNKALDLLRKGTDVDQYMRTAGEVESRDIQARQNLTPEQRAATAPYSSENIAKEDAIVMFGGSGPQASMNLPTQGLPDKDLIQEYAASRAARAAKEVEFEDDIDRQQVFGQQIGPERIKQTMQEAEAAAQEVFNGSEVPLTNEGLKQWMKTMDDFSVNNPESVNRVVELRNKSNSMAPTALQTELGIYTERMANATNDPTLFKTFINEVNDLVAVVGGVSDSARALVARRWSPLTERWGAAAKTLAEVKKNGPPDVDTTSDESANAANQEMTDALDEKRRALLEQDSKALAKLLSQVKGDVKWSDFFTNNSRISQKERQRRIYTQILKHDNLRNLSQAERLQLTRELDKAWARARKKVFLREFEKKIPLKNSKLKKQLAAQAPALLKAINLGTFDSQAYRKEISKTYGLKDLSDADLVKVIKLGAEIQDTDPLSRERRKKIMQLARVISGVTNIPLSHIVSAYYISSILASGRTGMGAAFSIVEVIMESIIGATVAGTRSPTQAMAGLNAAFKAFPRGLIEGLSHFWTGDKTGTLLASDAFNQFLGGEGYSPVSLGELLWKEKNPIKKFAGAVIVASERLLTGVDLTLSSTMHEASLIWANTATDFLDENGNKISIRNPTAADKAKMMDQVIAEEFGGVKPPMTPANLATINAAMRDQTERFYINEDPQNGTELVKTARRMASGPSFQGEVRGFMGEVVDRVNALFSDAGPKFEKWAEKNNVTGAKRDFLALFVGLSALGKAFAGMSFFGFVGRLINRNLQFVPGTALIPEIVLGTNPTQYEKKAMFAKNAVGFGLIILALQYILSDDDDDDNMFGLEGSGDTLSGDQRNAKRTTKALPNSIWYRDANGDKIYLSFANSSLSWVISAMANLREQKVNNPEKWAEATTEAKLAGGMFEAGKSILSTSAMGRLGELLGGGRAYSTGGVGAGVEGMASKIASFGGGFVPSVIREIDYLLDPNYYEPRTLAERAVSVIPFLRRQVADGQGSMGVFGSNAQINRSPTSRIYSSGADTEAEKILSKMQDEGLYLPLPDDRKGKDYVSPVSGRKIQMTKPQIMEYVKLTGEAYQRLILREGESLMTMDRDKAKERISKAASKIKSRAARMSMGIQE